MGELAYGGEGVVQWTPGMTLESVERAVVVAAFRHYRSNKTMTANSLGIAIRTLDLKLEKYAADDKAGTEKEDAERKRREDWLIKQRNGYGPDGPGSLVRMRKAVDAPAAGPAPAAGLRVESPVKAAPQPAMSVHERKEVQGMPPAAAAAGSVRKGR
jgi:hypothetical protein